VLNRELTAGQSCLAPTVVLIAATAAGIELRPSYGATGWVGWPVVRRIIAR
jgi:hypothetical protein